MALNNVELIRQYTMRKMRDALGGIRIFIAGTDDNEVAVEALRDQQGDLILAKMTDTLLAELGHKTEKQAEDVSSASRRLLKKQRRVTA